MLSSVSKSLVLRTAARSSSSWGSTARASMATKATNKDVNFARFVVSQEPRTMNQIFFSGKAHPSAPVFVGFAPQFNFDATPQQQSTTTEMAAAAASSSSTENHDSLAVLDDIFENHNTNVEDMEEEEDGPDDNTTAAGEEGLECRNRNNRSSKNKANHGKRPCNRQARRAKKIKIGRRRRS